MAVALACFELMAWHLNKWEMFSFVWKQQGHLLCGQNPHRCIFLPVGANSSVAFVSHLRCLLLRILHAFSIATRFVSSWWAILKCSQ
jgi:hypothetical protein